MYNMKLGARYKLIGKKKSAVLDLPYETVLESFEDALCNDSDSRLSGSVNRESGIFRIEYKMENNENDVYENYCMLVQLKESNEGTKIEYAFVFDRMLYWYTKILSVICFLLPLSAAALIYFKFNLHSLIHLLLYVPLILISLFGVFSLFGYREKKSDVQPMVGEFEQMLMGLFGGEN